MTVRFRIKDADGALVYDLIQNPPQTGVYADYSSIAINPLESGAWEHSIRMFAGAAVDKDGIQSSLVTLDGVTYQINRYGARPGSTDQLWLHEKSEAESTERRAILIGATFQPTWEGSVGPLMVNDSGWVGLLRLTRLDWEDNESLSFFHNIEGSGIKSVIDSWGHTITGSLSARISAMELTFEATQLVGYTVGFREENLDITNYQPVGNMGAGIKDADGNTPTGWPGGAGLAYEMIPYAANSQVLGYTWPILQAVPTYVGYYHHFNNAASYTHYIYLNEISESLSDSINDDYVGEYEIFIRFRILNEEDTAYYKFQLGYGDLRQNLAQNDPIYFSGADNPSFDPFLHYSLGKVKLPVSAYTTLVSGGYLSDYTFSVTSEIIGTPAANNSVIIDSIMLMPAKNVTVANPGRIPGSTVFSGITMATGETPSGNHGFVMDYPYNVIEVTGSAEAPPGKNTLVLLISAEQEDEFGSASLETTIYPKYLTSKS